MQALQSILLAIQPNANGNYYFENKAECLLYALIGFLVVFIGICFIILIIWLIGLLMKKTNGLECLSHHKPIFKRKGKASAPDGFAPDANAANGATTVVSPDQSASQTSPEEIPEEVKVAIVAAIMAYYQEQETPCEFKVKRIKRL